ncbi:nickel-cobalt-cadmium resistance protein [Advenella kashmirensis WT001]|uniref:Nickel-cobalt-cadmium resistance protein n=1 Tax=Advenella kashmirensis (strain DSM 17095 / LMG 22695 / WT001) TaxID=1036672 RepID=I3UFT8_ADVKW|nr:isoprenylcysteine carboxylmethyltransferase family protein [Advenella kashmirensis]AFK63876.1 nickel-cobalt-cadmium resistance protein [Advenella kashmirensis WT001]
MSLSEFTESSIAAGAGAASVQGSRATRAAAALDVAIQGKRNSSGKAAATATSSNTSDQAVYARLKHLSRVQRQRRGLLLAAALVIIALSLFTESAWRNVTLMHDLIQASGLVLILCGALGRIWSSLYLNGRKNTELMTHGPYSVTRNPLYVFSIMGVTGMGLLSGSLLTGLISGGLIYLVFNWVIAQEEGTLELIFGEPYRNYKRHVPRLGITLRYWNNPAHLEISMKALGRTVREALCFLLAGPFFILLNFLHKDGILPVIAHLF